MTETMKRNTGVELLRVISMLMVVVLHLLGAGGILAAAQPGTAVFNLAWLLECASLCAVNCYGLVSGWASVESKWKPARLVRLWLGAVFWTLLLTAGFAIFFPGAVGARQVVNAVFPVVTGQYWYFTAFFALNLLSPYLNRLLLGLDKKQHLSLCVTLSALFSVIPVVSGRDVFLTAGGYSFVWLVALYVAGAYARRWRLFDTAPKWLFLSGYALCSAAAWAAKVVIGTERLATYTSPLMLGAALCLLLFFVRVSPSGKLTKHLAPPAFGVYILHANPLVWVNVLSGRTAPLASLTAVQMILATLTLAAAVYIVCAALETARLRLFGWVESRILKQKLENIGGV